MTNEKTIAGNRRKNRDSQGAANSYNFQWITVVFVCGKITNGVRSQSTVNGDKMCSWTPLERLKLISVNRLCRDCRHTRQSSRRPHFLTFSLSRNQLVSVVGPVVKRKRRKFSTCKESSPKDTLAGCRTFTAKSWRCSTCERITCLDSTRTR